MGAFSASCHALRVSLRLLDEHKVAAPRVRAGAWAERSPQRSLEGKMSCTARCTPVPPCAGQSCCSPPGTSVSSVLSSQHGRAMGWGRRSAGAAEGSSSWGAGRPQHILVLPAWHRLRDLQAQEAVGRGRGVKRSGPGLHLPAGYSQAKLPPHLSTPAHGLCCRSAPR